MPQIRKRTVWLVILLITAAAVLLLAFDSRLSISFYSIPTSKIAGKVRVALITDLHSCQYGAKQASLIDAINKQAPDILLFGGDICDDILPHEHTEALLQGIAAAYPCYYVTGNHEYWSMDVEEILKLFQSYGVTILNGTCDTIEIRGQVINICGITDPDVTEYTDSSVGIKEQLEALKHIPENGKYTILLAHRPELIEDYAPYGFDLVLSGHAHGGQWRLLGIVNGIYSPNQGWFPKYTSGKYRVEDTLLIVSRGLARESTKIPRIFNRPELVVADLIGEP